MKTLIIKRMFLKKILITMMNLNLTNKDSINNMPVKKKENFDRYS
jgi:hypothetical protein